MEIKEKYQEELKETIIYQNGRVRVRTINEDENRADQTHKEACDINNIMKKFRNTGEWPAKPRQGVYLDHTNLPDYQKSLDIVREARTAFENQPSHIRKRFGNDPQEMIKFLADKENLQEAIKLGLVETKPEPQKSEAEKYYANQNAKEQKASKKQQQQNTQDE